jgi:DNA ligase-1
MQPQLLTVIEKETLKTWTSDEWKNWQIEAKRDGFRLLIVGGVPQSRSGKPLHNIDHILKELGNYSSVVFDGELHGDTWEQTSHVARASKSEREEKLTYTIFDALSVFEWENQQCERQLWERQAVLRHHIKQTEHIRIAYPYQCRSYQEFEGMHDSHLKTGCDGTVLKRKDSLYEFKRTKTWLKVKPALDCDALVVDMVEGTGKYKGMLGALVVLPALNGVDGKPVAVTTKVSGMDDDCRRAWWEQRHFSNGGPLNIMGKVIEVTYRKVNPSGRLVEPRFVRIRTDL